MTHALATVLSRDRRLVRRFLSDVAGVRAPKGARLEVLEQRFPGGPDLSEEEAGRKGLPDICIHDGDSWALLVEVKVTASVRMDQLRRHLATAERRGLSRARLLLLTADDTWSRPLPGRCSWKSWPTVYKWLRQHEASEWAGFAAEYLEIAESRLVEEQKHMDGALTTFAGFRFGPDNPYNYGEAKLMLRQALRELRSRKDLARKIGMDPSGAGRPAITGKDASSVWDFLPLKAARGARQFTNFPHLTLGVGREQVLAHVTLPNSMERRYRRNLKALSRDDFVELMQTVERGMRPIVRRADGATPWFVGLQRHYPTQRSQPVVDARLEFDLRTALPRKASKGSKVKSQSAWLDAAYEAYQSGGSNYQIAVGLMLPYAHCQAATTPRAIDLVAQSWLACKPLLSTVMARN